MFWANNVRQNSKFYADDLCNIYLYVRKEFQKRGVMELKIDAEAGVRGYSYDDYCGFRVRPDYLIDMLYLLQRNGFVYTFINPTTYMISIPDNLLLTPTHYNWP